MSLARCSTRRSVPRGQTLLVRAGEFAEHQRQIAFKRQQPGRLRQQAHRGVGIGGMPACHFDVVVQLIVAVPAEHHVAEAEALLQRRQEFVAAHVFAAHDAIDVEHADFDVIEIPLADIGRQILCGLDVEIGHENVLGGDVPPDAKPAKE